MRKGEIEDPTQSIMKYSFVIVKKKPEIYALCNIGLIRRKHAATTRTRRVPCLCPRVEPGPRDDDHQGRVLRG